MNFLRNNKREKFYTENSKLKTILLFFIFLFLGFSLFPLTTNAANLGGGTGDGEYSKPNVTNEADASAVVNNINTYCSYVSDSKTDSRYSQPDSYAIMDNGLPKAPMIDMLNGTGRHNTSIASEDVLEYEGFYYYDIKITLWNSGVDSSQVGYTRRTYYKYVELKKEKRGTYGTPVSLNNTQTGIWLYFGSEALQIIKHSI